MKRIDEVNGTEWPKDEDFVPDWGDVADAEHDRERDGEFPWYEDEDDYGPDDDGGENAQHVVTAHLKSSWIDGKGRLRNTVIYDTSGCACSVCNVEFEVTDALH